MPIDLDDVLPVRFGGYSSTLLVRFDNRNLEGGGSDLLFLPVGERNNDLGLALARLGRDPHGAIEGVPSATFI